ncbi:MAG: type VII secretion protein EccB [Propionibacteriaceae bacterium]|jgi:type VII secretion protein EccB|nr:type VII secretion protein EccB [Propionibacteriaceae bacterium]
MASPRDILEARRYNQRRLITVFASGTSEGQEYESRTPTGPVIIGVVLTVVLLIAAIIMGVFSPRLPAGWESDQIIIVKETGARYYTINGVLRPVTNIISARLLAGRSLDPIRVPASLLDGIPRGSGVGLTGVPDDIPGADHLALREWTACARPVGAPNLWIGEGPPDYTTAEMAVVTDTTDIYLIVDGASHKVIPPEGINLLNVLGLATATIHPVGTDWLGLFAEGTPFESLEIPKVATTASGFPHSWGEVSIGDVVVVTDQDRYLVSAPGTLVPLTPLALLLNQIGLETSPKAISATQADIGTITVKASETVIPQDWPVRLPTALPPTHRPCASITTAQDPTVAMTVRLGMVPSATAQDVLGRSIQIPGGSGALVRVSAPGTVGAVRLITDSGWSFSLGVNPTETIQLLGLGGVEVMSSPLAWVNLIESSSIELSRTAAWATVATT